MSNKNYYNLVIIELFGIWVFLTIPTNTYDLMASVCNFGQNFYILTQMFAAGMHG